MVRFARGISTEVSKDGRLSDGDRNSAGARALPLTCEEDDSAVNVGGASSNEVPGEQGSEEDGPSDQEGETGEKAKEDTLSGVEDVEAIAQVSSQRILDSGTPSTLRTGGWAASSRGNPSWCGGRIMIAVASKAGGDELKLVSKTEPGILSSDWPWTRDDDCWLGESMLLAIVEGRVTATTGRSMSSRALAQVVKCRGCSDRCEGCG